MGCDTMDEEGNENSKEARGVGYIGTGVNIKLSSSWVNGHICTALCDGAAETTDIFLCLLAAFFT